MYLHNTVVLNRRQLALQRTYSNIWKCCCCYMCVCAYTQVHVLMLTHITDTQRVEAKVAAKHPMMHRTGPPHPTPTKNSLVEVAIVSRSEKTWKLILQLFFTFIGYIWKYIWQSHGNLFPSVWKFIHLHIVIYKLCEKLTDPVSNSLP